MSLKNVHIVFIAIAAALAVFCAVQAFDAFRLDGSAVAGAAAVGAAATSFVLIGYEVVFLRRCRQENL